MMGAGKTTVGTRLAARLGWRYLDSDHQVESLTGATVREIFERDGEAAFRREETRALRRATSLDDPSVIGVAGGAVLDAGNRALLQAAGTVVWLRARTETLVERVKRGGDHRPLLAEDPEGTLARLNEERRPLYEEVADIVVDVDELDPDSTVERILAAL